MKRKLLTFLLALSMTAGCSAQATKPVEINENVDSCDICHMGIRDASLAAEVLIDGKPMKFDDIGCMVIYLQQHKNIDAAFVHAYDSKEWIDFQKSYFVHDSSIESPMGYGIAAFLTKQAAEKFANKHGGQVFSADELLKQNMMEFKMHSH